MRAPFVVVAFIEAASRLAAGAPCVDAKDAKADLGIYAVISGSHDARVIRRDKDCARLVGELPSSGPIAFVELEQAKDPLQPPDVVLDTWLMHGDRLRHRFVWSKHYVEVGEPQMIPGPRRK